MIYGNSGSPLVNSVGEIVGVIWGASKPETNANTPLSERRELKSEGLATEMIHFAEFTLGPSLVEVLQFYSIPIKHLAPSL